MKIHSSAMYSMKIWKNTKTLDGHIDGFDLTDSKEYAAITLLGSKAISLDEFPRLKGIFRAGIGKDNVPIEEARKRGIEVCFPSQDTIESIYEETANFSCHLILRMLYQSVGTLEPWMKYPRTALHNRTLLVIGTGNIGGRVAKKMRMSLNVETFDMLHNREIELDAMLKRADCISLHIPSTPENKDFIDAEKLQLFKDQAILINTARGAIVSEDALYHELQNKRLFAAFDVFWQEPYTGKLTEFYPERFFMTPHVASTCDAFLQGAARDLKIFIQTLTQKG